jgi:hypothetical protein
MIFVHLKMKKLISAYLDNEVNAKEKNLVEEHLKKCVFCRKHCESLQRLSSTLARYKEEELSPDLEQRIKNNFLGEKYKGVAKMKGKKLVIGISSGALAILLMFVFVGGLQKYLKRNMDGKLQSIRQEQGEQWVATDAVSRANYHSVTVNGDNIGFSGNYHAKSAKPALQERAVAEDARKSLFSENWINQAKDNTAEYASTTTQNGGFSGSVYSPNEIQPVSEPSVVPLEQGPIVIVEPYIPATGKEDKLIRNADIILEVKNIQQVYDEMVKIGKGKNGYLANADFNTSSNGRITAKIVLRVPKEKFEETIDAIKQLGQIKGLDIHSVDVSQSYNALVSELNTVKTIYDKIADKLKEKKTDIQQAIQFESQLTPIAERLAAIRNKISELDNLISVSTITINLYEISWNLMIQESIKETQQHFAQFVSSLIRNSIGLLPLILLGCFVSIACIACVAKLIRVMKKLFTKKSS